MSRHHPSTRADKLALCAWRDRCRAEDARCWLCTQPIDYEASGEDYSNDSRFQRDHYFPASTHGDLYFDEANWRPSHAGCNRERGSGAPRAGLGSLSRDW